MHYLKIILLRGNLMRITMMLVELQYKIVCAHIETILKLHILIRSKEYVDTLLRLYIQRIAIFNESMHLFC